MSKVKEVKGKVQRQSASSKLAELTSLGIELRKTILDQDARLANILNVNRELIDSLKYRQGLVEGWKGLYKDLKADTAKPAPLIIGLTGTIGSGKDTVAALLRMEGFERRAFADKLRAEVFYALCFESPVPETAPWFIKAIYWLFIGEIGADSVHNKPTGYLMRKLLQWWGAEYRRAQDPEYWLHSIDFPFYQNIVVSDVRFQNEADLIRSMGGVIWRVAGRGKGDNSHVSETNVKEIVPDAMVWNSGSLIQLADSVKEALKSAREDKKQSTSTALNNANWLTQCGRTGIALGTGITIGPLDAETIPIAKVDLTKCGVEKASTITDCAMPSFTAPATTVQDVAEKAA